jgi:hypothetical protein
MGDLLKFRRKELKPEKLDALGELFLRAMHAEISTRGWWEDAIAEQAHSLEFLFGENYREEFPVYEEALMKAAFNLEICKCTVCTISENRGDGWEKSTTFSDEDDFAD